MRFDFEAEEEREKNEKKKRKGLSVNPFYDFVNGTLVFIVLLLIIGKLFYFSPVQVSGDSMFGTLEDGDYLIFTQSPKADKQDIVSFKSPTKEGDYFVKRVIATAGDTLEYKDDQLFVNGEFVPEPYLDVNKEISKNSNNVDDKLTPDFTLKDIIGQDTVPEGEIFVMGDNRQNSSDSRYFGTIKLDNVMGTLAIDPKEVLNFEK